MPTPPIEVRKRDIIFGDSISFKNGNIRVGGKTQLPITDQNIKLFLSDPDKFSLIGLDELDQRSEKAKKMDAKRKAEKRLPLSVENIAKWKEAPDKYDLEYVDFIPEKKKNG